MQELDCFSIHGSQCFSRLDKYILISGMLKFDIGCTEEEILRDICELICSSTFSELDLSRCLPQDIEFVKCIGKMCRISQTSPGFTWNGMAVKHLCGQGDLYVCLKRDVAKCEESTCGSGHESFSGEDNEVILISDSRNDHTDNHSVATPCPTNSITSSTTEAVGSSSSTVGSSSSILGDQDLPGPSYLEGASVPSMDESCVTIAEIYEMFPNFSKKAIDMIHHLSFKNATLAINTLLDLSAEKILCLLQQQKMNGVPIR